MSDPVAQTTSGAVRGDLQDGISVFKGVPYGAPTDGAARFMPPQPPPRWDGVREARRYGDRCPQLPAGTPPAFASWANDTGESEDCLVLNVWTPGLADGRKRPVMLWLHGGGYNSRDGSNLVYDGVRLCQRGDVVVVTVNHRLNLFGYLYLAELAGDRFPDSGNVGQLDIIAALVWVRDNIEAFGGDPGRVMIFGQSGGGGKVATLMAMPAAKGLFHRAASESGSGFTGIQRDAATATAKAVCAAAGVAAGDLQHVETTRLVDALKTVLKDPDNDFGPVIDGRALPASPLAPGSLALSAAIPLVIGTNATEITVYSPPAAFDLDWPGVKARLTPVLAAGADVDALIAAFRRLRPDASPSDLYFLIATDAAFVRGTYALAEGKAAVGAAYLYRLEFETPVERLRTPHGLELAFVFDNVPLSTSILGPVAANAQKVADQMSAAWLAFARTGSPNDTGLSSWPRYDLRARPTMLFNVKSRAVNDPYSEERKIIAALPPGGMEG